MEWLSISSCRNWNLYRIPIRTLCRTWFRRAAGSPNKPGPFLSSRTISRYSSPHPYPTRPHRESNLTTSVLGLLAALPGTVRCRLPLYSRFPTRSKLISIVFFLVLGPIHPKFVPACWSKRSRADSLARPIPTAFLIVTIKPVDCGLGLFRFRARPFCCLSVHILSARMLFMACRKMSHGTRWMHYLKQLSSANVPAALIEKGQNRVIDASLTLIRERAKLKVTTAERCRLRVFCLPNSLFVPLEFAIKILNRVTTDP